MEAEEPVEGDACSNSVSLNTRHEMSSVKIGVCCVSVKVVCCLSLMLPADRKVIHDVHSQGSHFRSLTKPCRGSSG